MVRKDRFRPVDIWLWRRTFVSSRPRPEFPPKAIRNKFANAKEHINISIPVTMMTFPVRSGTSSVVHVGFGGKLSLAIITTKSQNLPIAIHNSLAGMWKSGNGRVQSRRLIYNKKQVRAANQGCGDQFPESRRFEYDSRKMTMIKHRRKHAHVAYRR